MVPSVPWLDTRLHSCLYRPDMPKFWIILSDGRFDPEARVPSSPAVGISAQKSEPTWATIILRGSGNAANEREHLKSFRETVRSHAKPQEHFWTAILTELFLSQCSGKESKPQPSAAIGKGMDGAVPWLVIAQTANSVRFVAPTLRKIRFRYSLTVPSVRCNS